MSWNGPALVADHRMLARGAPGIGWAARLLIGAIDGYQTWFAWRPSPCRYVPSCSTYMQEALQVHGAGRGGWLGVRRLSRCHPWAAHGEDPVPKRCDREDRLRKNFVLRRPQGEGAVSKWKVR